MIYANDCFIASLEYIACTDFKILFVLYCLCKRKREIVLCLDESNM